MKSELGWWHRWDRELKSRGASSSPVRPFWNLSFIFHLPWSMNPMNCSPSCSPACRWDEEGAAPRVGTSLPEELVLHQFGAEVCSKHCCDPSHPTSSPDERNCDLLIHCVPEGQRLPLATALMVVGSHHSS